MFRIFDKISIARIISDHISTLKDYGNSKYSKPDIILFFFIPFLISAASVYFGLRLNKDLVGILINVFSIFAGLLFNLLVLLYDVISKISGSAKSKQSTRLKIDLLEQVFSNISFEILLSLINVILLAISTLFDSKIANSSFSFFVFYLVILFTLSLLMVLKRVHKLLSDEIRDQKHSM